MPNRTTTIQNSILDLIYNKYIKSGGHNGCYLVEIKNSLNLTSSELLEALNSLKISNQVIEKQGHHGILIFYNSTNEKRKPRKQKHINPGGC